MNSQAGRWLALFLGTTALLAAELALRVRYRRRVLPPALPAGSAAGGVIVVALGDSITAGAPGDPAAAWPIRLEAQLQASYPAVFWRVINAGVSGDTAPSGYSRFAADVARAGPHAVLIAFGLNDCKLERRGLDRWLEGRVPAGMARSYLWRAIYVRGVRLGRRTGWLPGPQPETTAQPFARTSGQGFSAALAALVARSRDIAARPVLLTMTPMAMTPMAMTPMAGAEMPGVQARQATYPDYNARIRRLAAHEQCALVELAAGAPAEAFEQDGFHLSAAGQAWVADQVFRQLAAVGLWEQLVRERRSR